MATNKKTTNRTVSLPGVIRRSEGDGGNGRAISGRAIVFDQPVTLYEDDSIVVRERVARSAVDDVLIGRSDILLTMYHNPEIILGRSKRGKGTLGITIGDGGLDFTAEMPVTADGDTALELIRSGLIDGCSFLGILDGMDYENSRKITKGDDGRKVVDYTIGKIVELRDLTVCPNPVYPQTYVETLVRDARAAAEEIEKTINTETMDEEQNVTEVARSESGAVTTPVQGAAVPMTATVAPVTAEEMAAMRSGMSDLSRRVGALEHRPNAQGATVQAVSVERAVRDIVRSGQQGEIRIARTEGAGGTTQTPTTPVTINSSTVAAGGLAPLTVGEVIKPLREGIIYDKIGIKLPTGLAGDYYWPVVGSSLTAEVAGESVELTPQKIDFSKISPSLQRVGVTATLTRVSIFQSEGLLEQIVREQMPEAVVVAINAALLGTTATGNLTGPYAQTGVTSKTLANAYGSSTNKELNEIKATLLTKGYSVQGLVWVMSEGTKAILECTPVDAGSGRMVCENDRICGLPVFCSHELGTKIGLGDFRYQICGQFGTPSFVVDPVSGARKDEIYITLNMYFSTATLREDAFVLISPKVS